MAMTTKEIRKENFLFLSKDFKFQRQFCEKIGIKDTEFSQIKSGLKPIGTNRARKIEQAMSLPEGYMDQSHAPVGRRESDADTEFLVAAISKLPANSRAHLVRFIFSIAAELPMQDTASQVEHLTE